MDHGAAAPGPVERFTDGGARSSPPSLRTLEVIAARTVLPDTAAIVPAWRPKPQGWREDEVPEFKQFCEQPPTSTDEYLGRLYNYFCGTEGVF